MSNKRIAKHWSINPNITVDAFNMDEINKNNLINHLLVFKQSDLTFSMMMNLFGEFNGVTLCNPYDTFDVPAGAFKFMNNKGKEVSNKDKFTTTIGIWLFNIIFLRDYNFSRLFGGYLNENVGKGLFGDINQSLAYALAEEKIEVEEYKKFLDMTQYFMPFETILSPNHTEEILACSKKIDKKKQELIKKYKPQLDAGDFITAEKMEKELLDYAKEILGDDPGLDVYMSGAGASFGNNFKNIYVMKGAVKDPDPNAKQQFNVATSNFINGVSPEEYSIFANSLSAGPYSRSKKTEIGGHWEKLFSAALQVYKLGPKDSDCGSKKYIEVTLTKKNLSDFMYNYIIKSNGELEELTSDNCDKYIGKTIKMRFNIFCKYKDQYCFCNKCIGNFFYRRGGENVGLAEMQIPSILKNRAMKMFHDSTIKTVTIDPMKAFGFKN